MSSLPLTPARSTRIHLIGIGGSGLSAIARLLLESGYTVTGSDRSLSPLAAMLAESGVTVWEGHKAENVAGADIVVRSSAISDDNVEVQAAVAAGIPVLKRSQFLGRLMENHLTIAAAGTHGKTTITAMTAWALSVMDEDPSYIIGGTAKNLGGKNAHSGSGRAFVIEADEYDRMFLGLSPDVIIVSYLEHDHPDCFPTPEDYYVAFAAFTRRLRPGGSLLVSYDQPAARRLAAEIPANTTAKTYGLSKGADYTAENVSPNDHGGFDYDAYWHLPDSQDVHFGKVSLQVPGEHNVRNSLAVIAAVHRITPQERLETALHQAAKALSSFNGTGRRFDIAGEVNGVTLVDDYAHHPTEIRATLAAARARYPQRRIWALWQPHTFSRTRTLLDDFASAFEPADRVIVTEVYAAREQAADFNHFSAAQVVSAMRHPGVQFVPLLEEAGNILIQQLQPGDVLLVLSAGDADQVTDRVLCALQEKMA